MAVDKLDAAQVLADAGTTNPTELIQLGVAAAKAEDFEKGLIFLAEAFRIGGGEKVKFPPIALSSYGLCLAMHKGRYKEAAEFCQAAIEREFYNSDHYENLGRVWVEGGSRRKAVEAFDKGIALSPENRRLRKLREEIGVRRRPVIPFLHRDNPLNITLGRMRHRMKTQRLEGRHGR